jgi:hypothetical protein
MSGMHKRLRGFFDVLRKLPVEVTEYKPTGSSHYKIRLSCMGQQKLFVAAGSPSDCRAIKNFKGDVARWVRQVKEKS